MLWCGQVLCRDGKAVELSEKLTPGNASERARIKAAGGWITEERLVEEIHAVKKIYISHG